MVFSVTVGTLTLVFGDMLVTVFDLFAYPLLPSPCSAQWKFGEIGKPLAVTAGNYSLVCGDLMLTLYPL